MSTDAPPALRLVAVARYAAVITALLIAARALPRGFPVLPGSIALAGAIMLLSAAALAVARRSPRGPYRTLVLSIAASCAIGTVSQLYELVTAVIPGRQTPLLGVFDFIVLLAVLTTLLPHLYAAAAELMLARRDPQRYSPRERRRAHVVGAVAFVFVLYTIYGVGATVALWGFLVILAGMPLYVWLKTRDAGE